MAMANPEYKTDRLLNNRNKKQLRQKTLRNKWDKQGYNKFKVSHMFSFYFTLQKNSKIY